MPLQTSSTDGSSMMSVDSEDHGRLDQHKWEQKVTDLHISNF